LSLQNHFICYDTSAAAAEVLPSQPELSAVNQESSSEIGPPLQSGEERRQEFLQYLTLFGYNPNHTVLQVFRASLFSKPRARPVAVPAVPQRYGGTTFVVIGRTHDESIVSLVAPPARRSRSQPPPSEAYVGYLSFPTNKQPPHERLPLDFTPTHFNYPDRLREQHPGEAFLISLHVPSYFAAHKNELMRKMYRLAKTHKVENSWTPFLQEMEPLGSSQFVVETTTPETVTAANVPAQTEGQELGEQRREAPAPVSHSPPRKTRRAK